MDTSKCGLLTMALRLISDFLLRRDPRELSNHVETFLLLACSATNMDELNLLIDTLTHSFPSLPKFEIFVQNFHKIVTDVAANLLQARAALPDRDHRREFEDLFNDRLKQSLSLFPKLQTISTIGYYIVGLIYDGVSTGTSSISGIWRDTPESLVETIGNMKFLDFDYWDQKFQTLDNRFRSHTPRWSPGDRPFNVIRFMVNKNKGNLVMGDELGGGAFATVYSITYLGEDYAMRVSTYIDGPNESAHEELVHALYGDYLQRQLADSGVAPVVHDTLTFTLWRGYYKLATIMDKCTPINYNIVDVCTTEGALPAFFQRSNHIFNVIHDILGPAHACQDRKLDNCATGHLFEESGPTLLF